MKATISGWFGKANLPLMMAAVCFAAAAILVSHFRFYYGVGWHNALKWGVGDGFIWGLLLCAFVYCRQRPSTYFQSRRGSICYLALAVFCGVILHPTISTLLFWAIDGSISRPFLEDVLHLVMKRLPQGVLAGFVIGFAGIGAAGMNIRKLQSASEHPSLAPQTHAATWLALKNANGVMRVNIGDIQYVEAAGNYVALSAGDAEHLERTTLKAMEKQLQGRSFHRISRKHLVNLDHIRSIAPTKPKGGVVILENGAALPVSRQYKPALQDAFASLPQTRARENAQEP